MEDLEEFCLFTAAILNSAKTRDFEGREIRAAGMAHAGVVRANESSDGGVAAHQKMVPFRKEADGGGSRWRITFRNAF